MTKGYWAYEIQILMIVFMWLHEQKLKPTANTGIQIGKLYIWIDRMWFDSFKSKINNNKHIRALKSIREYFQLHKAGLWIGKWEDDTLPGDYVRYRFFWKDELIREIPDIVRVRQSWRTVNNGHVGKLGEPNYFYNKEFHHIRTVADTDFIDDGNYPYIPKINRVGPNYNSKEWQKMMSNIMSEIKINTNSDGKDS